MARTKQLARLFVGGAASKRTASKSGVDSKAGLETLETREPPTPFCFFREPKARISTATVATTPQPTTEVATPPTQSASESSVGAPLEEGTESSQSEDETKRTGDLTASEASQDLDELFPRPEVQHPDRSSTSSYLTTNRNETEAGARAGSLSRKRKKAAPQRKTFVFQKQRSISQVPQVAGRAGSREVSVPLK